MSSTSAVKPTAVPAADGFGPIIQVQGLTKVYRVGDVDVHALTRDRP